jgi:hypothetical protein
MFFETGMLFITDGYPNEMQELYVKKNKKEQAHNI